MDGLIGLTRSHKSTYPMIVPAMHRQGAISQNIFALYLTGVGHQSSIQFGDYDPSYLKDPSTPLTWIRVKDPSMFWDVDVQAFRYGLSEEINGVPSAWTITGYSLACLDSGTSLMYMPYKLYQKFKAILKTQMKVTESKYGDLYGSCDLSKYESVYLLMGGTWFEIPPSVYVESGIGKCFI
jgi:hypothetical protein